MVLALRPETTHLHLDLYFQYKYVINTIFISRYVRGLGLCVISWIRLVYCLFYLVCEVLVMKLVERDYKIFMEVDRWRVCLGRHIQPLTGFSSQRSCDERLHMLLSENFLTRHIVIYGIPSVYSLTRKSKNLISANKRQEKIRLDQVVHDVTVLDTAIRFMQYLNLSPYHIKTDKQLHQQDRLW